MNPKPDRARPRRGLSWWLLPVGILAGLATATVFALTRPSVYRATSTLAWNPELALDATPSPARDAEFFEDRLAVAMSPTVLAKVDQRLKENHPNDSSFENHTAPDFQATLAPGHRLVLSATSLSKDRARDSAVAWASEFVEFQTQEHRNLIGSAEAQVQQQILSFENKLEQAQRARDDFLHKNTEFAQIAAEASSLRPSEMTRQELQQLRVERRQIQTVPAQSFPSGAVADRLLDLKFAVKQAENRLTVNPTSTALESLKSDLALKRADLESYLGLIAESQGDRVKAIELRETEVNRLDNELTQKMLDSADLRRMLERLSGEEQILKDNLGELNRRLQSLGRLGYGDETSIVSAGISSPDPLAPAWLPILGAGLGGGVLFGLLLMAVALRMEVPRDPPSATTASIGEPVPAQG